MIIPILNDDRDVPLRDMIGTITALKDHLHVKMRQGFELSEAQVAELFGHAGIEVTSTFVCDGELRIAAFKIHNYSIRGVPR